MRAEGAGNVGRTVEERDNEYQPVSVLRPVAVSRCIASPTNLSEVSSQKSSSQEPWNRMWLSVPERHKAVESNHAGVPLRSAFQRNCHEGVVG